MDNLISLEKKLMERLESPLGHKVESVISNMEKGGVLTKVRSYVVPPHEILTMVLEDDKRLDAEVPTIDEQDSFMLFNLDEFLNTSSEKSLGYSRAFSKGFQKISTAIFLALEFRMQKFASKNDAISNYMIADIQVQNIKGKNEIIYVLFFSLEDKKNEDKSN